jgi:hypothetical protein
MNQNLISYNSGAYIVQSMKLRKTRVDLKNNLKNTGSLIIKLI